MKKFKYKVDVKREFGVSKLGGAEEQKYLDEMGNQGWELVSVEDRGFGNAYIYYWKKEVA